MKIYTKTGDKGYTSLIGGKRVKKNDRRVEAYGALDELDSFIGLLKNMPECSQDIKNTLETIQERLFYINCLFALSDQTKSAQYAIKDDDITLIEKKIDEISGTLPPLTKFLIPGENIANAVANICRTVCRRAERRIYAISNMSEEQQQAAIYINRLSDYFFTIGRILAEK